METRHERLYVAPEMVPCEGGAGPQRCLQVRTSPDAPWELFYDEITGFEYVPGTSYILLVEVAEVPEPAADASSYRYTLVKVEDEDRIG